MTHARKEGSLDPKHPALSADRPLFVDNQNGNTLDAAICAHLKALRQENAMLWGLDIATAFFNLPGFALVADEIERVGKVRLLLGAEPRPEAAWPVRKPGDKPPAEFLRHQVEQSLDEQDAGLRRSVDLLPFDDATDAVVRRLLEFLHSGKIEVRRFETQYLHAKAFLFRVVGGGLLVGSSNLTQAGLRGNLELNLGHYEDPVVNKVESWFDELWDRAAPFDLAAIYDRLLADYPPYWIYLRVLWELYGQELEEEAEESGDLAGLPTTTFQRHAVWRALRIMKRYGGALVADGVGLGKTYVAGEIIRIYRSRRQKVLLICPASLRDSTWKRFLHKFEFDRAVECVSYEELAADHRLGGDSAKLQRELDEYQLIVIDEAHNYRNPASKARAKVLRELLRGDHRDVLMLSATPVNNTLWDLYHLLRYYIKQDAAFADRGVISLRSRFKQAMAADAFNLNPDLLYPIIDATTVKRTRQEIIKYYSDDLVDVNGVSMPIRFPKPVASSIKYNLEAVLPGFFVQLENALAPTAGTAPALSLARYQPDKFLLTQQTSANDSALVGLLRTGLLKRFESSSAAFAKTAAKMAREHDVFLRVLDGGRVPRKELLHELSAADDDDLEEILDGADDWKSADDYDIAALRAAVTADRDLLIELAAQSGAVEASADPKLAALVEELVRITKEARQEAIDDDDERAKRKVLIFSFYEDTIDWIEQHLRALLANDHRLTTFRDRMASVTGADSRNGVPRAAAIGGFAPESSGLAATKGEFDLLLCTDVLAEGMNLQQCRNIINYDLPWNPMRLIQRHGRVDRINSKHSKVFLRTFFPDQQLDGLLKLEERVRRKLARAARSVGVEDAPIEQGTVGDQSFAENRQEIERLLANDASLFERGGTSSAAQTGEAYRQELRRALARLRDAVIGLPWKAGSGLVKGTSRGHFFLAKVGERFYTTFVPIDDTKPLETELGACLRMIECREDTPGVMPEELHRASHGAWKRAQENVFERWERETDPVNLQPSVAKLNRDVATFLDRYPPREVPRERLLRCLDAIKCPWPNHEAAALREVFERSHRNNTAKSLAILQEVERLGMEPFHAPEPLPPISLDEVQLVCWLAIEAESE